jgi:predicted peptidase
VIDRSRVYAVGHSNGGLFTSNLAIHLTIDHFTSIVNHMGGISDDQVKAFEKIPHNKVR